MEFKRSFLRRHLAARETSGRVAKCQLFSQAREVAVRSSVTSCVRFQFVSWSSWSLKFVFSGPIRNLVSFGVLSYIQAITFIALEKCKKNAIIRYGLKYSGVRFFVYWKWKLLNFLMNSVIILRFLKNSWSNVRVRFSFMYCIVLKSLSVRKFINYFYHQHLVMGMR